MCVSRVGVFRVCDQGMWGGCVHGLRVNAAMLVEVESDGTISFCSSDFFAQQDVFAFKIVCTISFLHLRFLCTIGCLCTTGCLFAPPSLAAKEEEVV